MGHVFHLAWYMNGVGFGDSSRTSVPKIMASYPPPPPVDSMAVEKIAQVDTKPKTSINEYDDNVKIRGRVTSMSLSMSMGWGGSESAN